MNACTADELSKEKKANIFFTYVLPNSTFFFNVFDIYKPLAAETQLNKHSEN